MRIIDVFTIIPLIDNGWTFAAFIAALIYLYLIQAPS